MIKLVWVFSKKGYFFWKPTIFRTQLVYYFFPFTFSLFLINCGRTRDSRIRISFFPCNLCCIVISKLYLVPVVSKTNFPIFFQLFKKDNSMTSIENFYILGLIFVYHKSITHTYQTFLHFDISALASVHPFVCMYINPYISHTLVFHHSISSRHIFSKVLSKVKSSYI